MSAPSQVSRREFLETTAATGAGLVIGFHLPAGGRFAAAAAAPFAPNASLPVPENPTLKDPKDWKILGHRVRRLDTPDKVDGSAQFGIDVKRPGMLVAVVARCPTIGGKVASFDATKAKAVPGVKDVVQI